MALSCSAKLLRGGLRVPRIVQAFRRSRESLRHLDRTDEPLARRQYAIAAERLRCAPAAVEEVIEEWIYTRPLKWLPRCRRHGVLEALDAIRARGLRTGVFSDYPAARKLAALGVGDRFDFAISAVDADIDAFKPDPRGFLAAAARWALTPAQVLYVGDRADVDAAGARAAGMRCIVLGAAADTDAFIAVREFLELPRVVGELC